MIVKAYPRFAMLAKQTGIGVKSSVVSSSSTNGKP